MTKAAHKAARNIVRDYGEVGNLQVSRKGTMDFVTQTDIRSEKIIREELTYARPKFGLLLEESGETVGQDKDNRWVVDPIDGTSNFIHAVPYFCVSIAHEKRRPDGVWEPQCAVIYEPLRDELFHAEKGNGAFCNDRRIQVSARKILEESLLITHAPKHDKSHFELSNKLYQRVIGQCKGIRTMGATALDMAYIAAGRFDVGWYTHFKRWDISAGLLMVQEAGGLITQLDGSSIYKDNETASILLGAPKLQQALEKLFKD